MNLSQVNSLNIFIEAIKNQKLPIKTSFKIAKLQKALEVESEFYQKNFREIILKHSEKDAEGNPVVLENGNIQLLKEHEEECAKEMSELFNTQTDIELPKFTLEDFENVELTSEELRHALILFEEKTMDKEEN